MAVVLHHRTIFLGNPVNHGIEGTVFKVVCQIGALSTVKTTGSILTGSILPPTVPTSRISGEKLLILKV